MGDPLENEKQDKHWTLDRKVPLALIVAVAVQTFSMGWFAAALSSRVDILERQATGFVPQTERLIRLETKMENLREGLVEIKALLRPPSRP